MIRYYNCNVIVKKGDYLDKYREITYSDENINTDTYLFTNESMKNIYSYICQYPIGLLLETKNIIPYIYSWTLEKLHYESFYHIFTHDKECLEADLRFSFYPLAGCWIDNKDRNIYPKNKLLSIIASNKNVTEGHKLRHEVIKIFSPYINGIYGYGYNPVQNKVDALRDFRYSIVIENGKYDYNFTEKIIDCFAVGTVPIYWGCPSIGNFFDIRGIILFEDEKDLYYKIKNLSIKDYEDRLPYIENNFNLVSKYDHRPF